MFKVTPAPAPVHDLLAAPLGEQQIGDTGLTVLVLLVTLAILLFQALRAVVGAVLSLLLPAVALFRQLVLVVGLIGVVGYGMAAGSDEEPAPPPAPAPTAAIR